MDGGIIANCKLWGVYLLRTIESIDLDYSVDGFAFLSSHIVLAAQLTESRNYLQPLFYEKGY